MSCTRRLAVASTVTAALAAVTLPALAATPVDPPSTTQMTYVTVDGARQFSVTEVDGTTPLAGFTFGSDKRHPFRTNVADSGRLLDSEGYQVAAKITNLYRVDATKPGGYDFASKIPSSSLSLAYGSTPLTGSSLLAVVPAVSLNGVVGDCRDPDIASAVGLTVPLPNVLGLVYDTALALLDAPLRLTCTALDNLTLQQATVDTTVKGIARSVDAALPLSALPFALTGADEGGPFTNPSFQGPIASLDPAAAASPPAATSKQVMKGSPLFGTAGITPLLGSLTTALTTQLAGVPLLSADNSGVVTVTSAFKQLAGPSSALVSALSGLTSTSKLSVLQSLSPALAAVGLDALSTTTGTSSAFPVLQADPVSTRAGTYNGTLIVDFFETAE